MTTEFAGRDELAPIFWYLTYFHEAGHAVAAARRAQPVKQIYVHPTHGYTRHGDDGSISSDDDIQFIVAAGPWAEVCAMRMMWGVPLDVDTAELRFAEQHQDYFRKNAHDWCDYHRALGHAVTEDDYRQVRDAAFGLGNPPSYEALPSGGWSTFSAELWNESRTLALLMLSAEDEIDVGYGQPALLRSPEGDRPGPTWTRPEIAGGDLGSLTRHPQMKCP